MIGAMDGENVTLLLRGWMEGDDAAKERLFDVTYKRLHDLAVGVLRFDRQRDAVQPTQLVNECAIRLLGLNDLTWQDRSHFMAMAATTMRRILVDEARRRQAQKRLGAEITLSSGLASEMENTDVIEVNAVLEDLERVSHEMAKVVELKYFGGLTNREVGVVMGTSETTVKRQWRAARAWLHNELSRAK